MKKFFMFLVIVGLLFALSLSSRTDYPATAVANEQIKIKIIADYQFDRSTLMKAELFVESSDQPLYPADVSSYFGSGTKIWEFPLRFTTSDTGQKKFKYRVSYSDQSTQGYVVCGSCSGDVIIQVSATAPASSSASAPTQQSQQTTQLQSQNSSAQTQPSQAQQTNTTTNSVQTHSNNSLQGSQQTPLKQEIAQSAQSTVSAQQNIPQNTSQTKQPEKPYDLWLIVGALCTGVGLLLFFIVIIALVLSGKMKEG